ncbi:hypothetical protein C6H66_12590 [Photorhabdus hindustanensis]|uniref:Uncharacterized protein n=1 Tax=Photorhabdus hindustanensis TaxID=2918802 RepID=A0A2S8Q1I6_9GAMM|nr:hypothetical protein C6H66_12590 [Photorhabdus hindustanensis]
MKWEFFFCHVYFYKYYINDFIYTTNELSLFENNSLDVLYRNVLRGRLFNIFMTNLMFCSVTDRKLYLLVESVLYIYIEIMNNKNSMFLLVNAFI